MSEPTQDNRKGYVTWTIFTWVTTGMIGAFGYMASISTKAESKAETAIDRVADVEGDIKAIKSDVEWIRQILEKQK